MTRMHPRPARRPRLPHAPVDSLIGALAVVALSIGAGPATAGVGLTRLAATGEDGPVTVFYPSDAAERPVRAGWQQVPLATEGAPGRSNGRLVVLSHGSGGGPWVHLDLARRLVGAGFVVALPQHQGDHSGDPSTPGPQSWTRRPGEVRRAIDSVLADGRWPGLDPQRVGLWGLSAGGHTALELAGGRWSPARFAAHCQAHIADDFAACVGLYAELNGGLLDGFKRWLAPKVLAARFGSDDAWRAQQDPRIAAVVAVVPLSADFEPDSLKQPSVPLGLVNARQDRWLAPTLHGLQVLQGCATCEDLGTLDNGGHGALLSPPPPVGGLTGRLLNDPPGFDRAVEVPPVLERTVAFFERHLGR